MSASHRSRALRLLVSSALLCGVGVALAADAVVSATLPAPMSAKVEAYKKVAWGERLRPERPDPAPDGWQARVEAEWALGSLDAKSATALLPMLKDSDRFVRALAARSLGLTQPAGALPALIAAISGETDKGTRVPMIEAIARVGGPGALEAVEALDTPGADADIVAAIGFARRQLKGGKWDVESMRAEHVEAVRTKLAAEKLDAAAPELALPSATGVVNLSAHKGKVVVLVFAHGDRGLADLKAIQRMPAEKETLDRLGVVVIVVDPHEKERTKIWNDKVKLPFIVASDPSGRAQAAYGLARQLFIAGEWLPSPGWFVIDREGVVRWQKIGRRVAEQASLGELLPVIEAVARGQKPQ